MATVIADTAARRTPPGLSSIPASLRTKRLTRPRPRGRHADTGPLAAIDAYFRSRDTLLAQGLAQIARSTGPAYTASGVKRTLDLTIAIPLALIAIALIVLLLVANRILSPRRPALFRQDRVGRRGTLRVLKIRSMVADPAGSGTPVSTSFGRFIRRYYLDEMPQVLQVIAGRLSLVGIRVLPRNVYDGLAGSWSAARFETWETMYAAAPLGLSGTHQVFRRMGKEDSRRFHHDMFYARHASLGFDLYLLWRTLGSRDKEVRHDTATRNDRHHRAA